MIAVLNWLVNHWYVFFWLVVLDVFEPAANALAKALRERFGRWFGTQAALYEIVGGYCIALAVYAWVVTR
jgi:hypothetical protein